MAIYRVRLKLMMNNWSGRFLMLFIVLFVTSPSLASGEEQKKHFLTLSGITQMFTSTERPIPHKAIFGMQIDYTRLFSSSKWGIAGGVSGAFSRKANDESTATSLFFQATYNTLQRRHRLLLSAGPEFGYVIYTENYRDVFYPQNYDPHNPTPVPVVPNERGLSGPALLARTSISWISPWHISASANYSMGSLINQSVFLGCATFTVGIHL
jgi:hypothetical protein